MSLLGQPVYVNAQRGLRHHLVFALRQWMMRGASNLDCVYFAALLHTRNGVGVLLMCADLRQLRVRCLRALAAQSVGFALLRFAPTSLLF